MISGNPCTLNPGPPPSEGLRSTRTAPNLSAALVAPAPNVIRDYTRNGVQLESVIAPAPTVARDRPLTAPKLSVTLIAPAPNVVRDHALVAPALGPAVIPPAPNIARERTQIGTSFEAGRTVCASVSNRMKSSSRSASNK